MTTISKWLLCGFVLVPLALVLLLAGRNNGYSGQGIVNADDNKAAVEPKDAAPGSAAVAAAVPVKGHDDSYAEVSHKAEAKILRGLQTKVTLEFDDTSLQEAMKTLAARAKLPLLFDETAMSEEGIAIDEPLSARIQNRTAEHAIDRLLKPIGLTWIIENEVLLITTLINAEERFVRRVYDVKGLLDWNEQAQRLARGSTENPLPGAFHFSGDEVAGDWLIEAIQQHSTGPWDAIDGVGGTPDLVDDRLIVRQSQPIQKEVLGMLTVFEDFIQGRLKSGSKAVRRPGYSYAVDLAIQQSLLKKASADFKDSALRSVLSVLGKEIGHTILLDKIALSEEGIADDEPISLVLEEISVQSLLTLILEPLGCTYYVEEGTVWVTTEIAAEETLFVTVYDVRDLLKTESGSGDFISSLQKDTSGPWEDIEGAGGTLGLALPGMLVCRQTHKVHAEIALSLHDMRKRLAEIPQSKPRPQPDPHRIVVRFYPIIDRERATDLEKAIVTFVAPGTWKSKNGEATIRVVGETLVIGNTAGVHKQIRKFLDDLRSAEDSDASDFRPSSPSGGGGSVF
ncbi:MAG: hypothetical protein HON53_04595 [Planctomycetaceae bacterium]|nr:hypothetical protein [Planctomycetaceae bacterium]